MSIPTSVRHRLRAELWARADAIDWTNLALSERSKYYAWWTEDEDIGGVLSGYIDKGRVRVYIKDTLLKAYSRQLMRDDALARRVIGIQTDTASVESYRQPHGRRYADGRQVFWGRSDDWKLILLASFERAFGRRNGSQSAVILTNAVGRYAETAVRAMIDDAASRLGVDRVVWLEFAENDPTGTTVPPHQDALFGMRRR